METYMHGPRPIFLMQGQGLFSECGFADWNSYIDDLLIFGFFKAEQELKDICKETQG